MVPTAPHNQRGISIVEFLIALGLSLLVLVFAVALFSGTRATYRTQDESARLNETGRFVSQTLTRLIRQSAYVHRQDRQTPINLLSDNFDFSVQGYNSGYISQAGLQNPPVPPAIPAVTASPAGNPGSAGPGLNSSDSISLRFFGAGSPGLSDQSITDCVGQPIPAPLSAKLSDQAFRGANHLFINLAQPDSQGNREPQLACRWRSVNDPAAIGNVTTASLALGIEALQFLYGINTGTDVTNQVDTFLRADQVNALAVPPLPGAGTGVPSSAWQRVVAVKYAFVVRSGLGARTDADTTVYNLFGTNNDTDAYNYAADPGSRIDAATLPAAERTRLRKVFSGVVHLRNESGGSGS